MTTTPEYNVHIRPFHDEFTPFYDRTVTRDRSGDGMRLDRAIRQLLLTMPKIRAIITLRDLVGLSYNMGLREAKTTVDFMQHRMYAEAAIDLSRALVIGNADQVVRAHALMDRLS